ncbi:hypothetical protein [Lentzea sp. NBRC 102530]|uniref:hypothetical protein n=1 Tax=Lentzea sp. NBRC 102530 TaxID=3032201 RepID=UPI0024A216DB|nr:hypothetical protein [Lentzea sp. NBRC 102530]GLY55175.1 hypothetical protein Lesp01_88300 [Lentzea sp. NBRC 102530]
MSAEIICDPLVELYAAGDWHDITGDVRYQGGIAIDRGRGGEDDTSPPQTCRVTLDDRNGDYNPRDPNGAYFGTLGRNTPLRVSLMVASSGFGTNVVDGWGSTDDVEGQGVYPWSTTGTAGDYDVAVGVGTVNIPAAGQIRIAYLADLDVDNVEARVTFTLPTSNVTGGAVAPANIMLHGQGAAAEYYMLRLNIRADETISLDFWTHAGASILFFDPYVVPGLVHTGQALRVAFGIEGRTLRAKIWPAADPEPYAWDLVFTDEDVDNARPTLAGKPGWVGIRTSLVAGNTNAPMVISYEDFELRHPRFAGEVSSWPATRNITSTDITTTVTASGPKRRGTQGAAPLDSPYRRALSSGARQFTGLQPVAYWPLEDKFRQVTGEVLAVYGAGRLAFTPPTTGTTAGKITWASDSTLPGSDALPTLTGGGSLVGELSPRTRDSGWFLTWAQRFSVEDGSFNLFSTVDDHMQFAAIVDPGTPTVLTIYLTAPGVSAAILTHTFASKEDAEDWHTYQLEAEHIGPDTAMFFYVDGEFAATHTQFGMGLRGLVRVQFSSPTNATRQTAVGHIAVWNFWPPASAIHEAAFGNTSERAGQRMERLCEEEGVSFDWVGVVEPGYIGPDPAPLSTPRVGPQEIASLLSNMEDSARVDQGMLFEQRARIGYRYRTLGSLYNQTPRVTLDYSAGEIAPEWRPVDDDRYTRNDITVQRSNGGSYRHRVTTGRLSALPIEQGGADVYRDSVTVNVQTDGQLPGIAEWRGHLGTVDETRYPAVQLQLHGHALRGNAAKLLALLDLDLGDRLVIENVSELGVLADIDQLVIGYRETITQHEHSMTLVCAPASPYRIFVLDDTVYGRLDSDSSSLTTGISDSATSWQVTTSNPLDLWTTNPAHFPLDILVGGERITLSAITGTSSPQTFTASARSVNNIVKGHAAGAEVHVAYAVYLGL